MYYIGEGEDKKPVFEMGDEVRINDQGHAYCGCYGIVNETIGGEKMMIETSHGLKVEAFQSQVEAN